MMMMMMMMMNLLTFAIVFFLIISVNGLSLSPSAKKHQETQAINRRSVIHQISAFGFTAPFFISKANAVDAQFAEVGQQEKPPNGETPFVKLPNGVQIKDFRGGSGAKVDKGSKVELTMKGRLLNLNGVIFYDTKTNDPNGFGEGTPLLFTVGDGTVLPGIESGIIGMQKGGIRRIIVPADQGYGSFPTLEPQPFTDMERRALDSVVKNPRRDQTVLFDVKLERVR